MFGLPLAVALTLLGSEAAPDYGAPSGFGYRARVKIKGDRLRTRPPRTSPPSTSYYIGRDVGASFLGKYKLLDNCASSPGAACSP
jgi:hypothetical protein